MATELIDQTKYKAFQDAVRVIANLEAGGVTLEYIQSETAKLSKVADECHEAGFLSDTGYNNAILILDLIRAKHKRWEIMNIRVRQEQ